MKKLVFALCVMLAFVAAADVVSVAAPGSVSNGASATNEIAMPADAVGRARIVVAQSGMSTNTPTVFALYTYDANTNAVPLAARLGLAPVTNGLAAVEIIFPALSVNRRLLLVTNPATNITRSAVLVYTPKYPKR